ncbi:bifunctional diguanylate cyclase/phosphodiesterase [Nocardioides mangrovicus]|uniref:Bifunctional diguanylate cyclase/phosphodiesterase n=1 Tax=Nocardioides mangrovicus TaxID=2478913 RepID=A0A3L8P6D0_9ACTN|nr:bifunctional diguanylate cyclase/phosphodiesterase [Nocardioides mangrovicus]
MRLFLVYAIAILVPVLVLGAVLAATYRSGASDRGLAQARAQAALFGRTSVEPRLDGVDLSRPLSTAQVADLDQMGESAVRVGDIVRFRIRTLSGRVIYSNDRTGSTETDEEAQEAAHGETVAEITHLNADEDGDGAIEKGIRVAEVYTPLTDGTSARPTGVLELYLPYDPIARDIAAGMRSLYRDLAIGLVALYLVLAGISWSITRALRRLAEHNGYLASYDQLTGLPNRRSFHDELEAGLARRERQGLPTTIAIVDLDRFQEVNDTLGHDNGDALLVEVGRRIRRVLAEPDHLARLGGDEFAIVFDAADAVAVDEQLLALTEAMTEPIDLAGIPVEVELTVGVARAPEDGTSAVTLLQRAGVATDVAKRGGLRVVHYEEAGDPYDPNRLSLIGDLRRAIRDDELELHYQPKIDLRTGAVAAVEALLRWQHPERGRLMPDEFLPVIEQTGMIDPLTDWVIETALAWVGQARTRHPQMRVAVNVSARNLGNADFASHVTDALARTGSDPGCLTIEITETALMADPARATASLMRLAKTGVLVSVDDFGQGQTSLSQLARLPVAEVKIDKAFVMHLDQSATDAAIVQSITDLAHRLGLEVVAEGVESQPILELLRDAGCEIAQGYHISRPMPAAVLARWLADHDVERFASAAPAPTGPSGRHRREDAGLAGD